MNYYGSLCTEMYEILHATPPQDELDFYLSFAKKGMAIFEPLCGNGRFMIPFIERELNIYGNDLSQEMLDKCLLKCPKAQVDCCDIIKFKTDRKFDYIFIPSGSIGLFTDLKVLEKILKNFHSMLNERGRLVFAVDTTFFKAENNDEYKIVRDVEFDHKRLILKIKSFYDEKTHTQFQPQVYELLDGEKVLQSEEMDFQIHLYDIHEMDDILTRVGFKKFKTYTDYDKNYKLDGKNEFLIYDCEK